MRERTPCLNGGMTRVEEHSQQISIRRACKVCNAQATSFGCVAEVKDRNASLSGRASLTVDFLHVDDAQATTWPSAVRTVRDVHIIWVPEASLAGVKMLHSLASAFYSPMHSKM
jgi:hypothetical protein